MGVVSCSGRGLGNGRCLQCGRGLWEGAWLRAVGGASLPLRSPVETPGAALGECGDPGIRDTVGGVRGGSRDNGELCCPGRPCGDSGDSGERPPGPLAAGPGGAGRARAVLGSFRVCFGGFGVFKIISSPIFFCRAEEHSRQEAAVWFNKWRVARE